MSSIGVFATRLLRSAGAGVVATLVDLGLLSALVQLFGMSPRAASVPALLVGNVLAFYGQKYLAFRSPSAQTGREALSFAAVEGGGFLLNASLFELAMRALPVAFAHYVIVRLLITNGVWLFYSFPLCHLVFRPKPEARTSPP